MREILFRGKQTDNGEWCYGLLSKTTVIAADKPAYVATTIDEEVKKPFDGFWHEVDPKTVGQFTGLTDKNGKRIFEGDILRYNRYRYSVIFEEGAFNCDGFLDNSMDCPYYAFSQGTHHFEVIGNIHDNPELMDGKS